MEASKKGVKSEYYQQYLDETDWIEIALTFLNKKIPNDLELTFENKQKYLASLARRGFSTSDCLEAMERYESDRFYPTSTSTNYVKNMTSDNYMIE